jgi:hypothetical protein
MRRFHFALLSMSIALAAGCSGSAALVGHQTESLAQLPDCSFARVTAAFQAEPTGVDGIYVVRDQGTDVCATDFDGLQLLDHHIQTAAPAPGTQPLVIDPNMAVSSDPMPGRGSDPAASAGASDPMPGRDNNPAASDPMPGHGTNPAASDPMPGRDSNGTVPIRLASSLSR